MMFRLGNINIKIVWCPVCKMDFHIWALSDRFMVSRYKEQYDLGICNHCYMLGFNTRENYIDWRRSYAK